MNGENPARTCEPHLFDPPLTVCPTCRAERPVPVNDAGSVHFACRACGRAWRVEFGVVWRVDSGDP